MLSKDNRMATTPFGASGTLWRPAIDFADYTGLFAAIINKAPLIRRALLEQDSPLGKTVSLLLEINISQPLVLAIGTFWPKPFNL